MGVRDCFANDQWRPIAAITEASWPRKAVNNDDALSAVRDGLEVAIEVLADDFIFCFRPFALVLKKRIYLICAGAVGAQGIAVLVSNEEC